MATRTKAAKKGAVSASQAVRENEYIQRLIEDAELRDNLREAYESARKAYGRIANGRGPAKALLDDKKTQKQLQNAAVSLREAAEGLRGKRKRKKRGRGGKLVFLLVLGTVGALVASEDLRKKVLDLVFGAEEEFEYTSATTPETSAPPPQPSA